MLVSFLSPVSPATGRVTAGAVPGGALFVNDTVAHSLDVGVVLVANTGFEFVRVFFGYHIEKVADRGEGVVSHCDVALVPAHVVRCHTHNGDCPVFDSRRRHVLFVF